MNAKRLLLAIPTILLATGIQASALESGYKPPLKSKVQNLKR